MFAKHERQRISGRVRRLVVHGIVGVAFGRKRVHKHQQRSFGATDLLGFNLVIDQIRVTM
jgi:hypothetical protein